MANETNSINKHIAGRKFKGPMRRALQQVLEGESYRSAAAAESIDHADLFKAARSVPGLRRAHLQAWHAGWGKDFPPMWRQHFKHVGDQRWQGKQTAALAVIPDGAPGL